VSPEERRALLGNDVIEHLRAEVAAAPPPPPDVIDRLRVIFTHPGRRTPAADQPAA
jgi:hypothetical protein